MAHPLQLDAIASYRPDAVILDMSLPDIKGTEVYERVAAAHPDLPVFFSSGHGDESTVEPYFTTNHVGFVRKPYDLNELQQALEKITRQSPAARREATG